MAELDIKGFVTPEQQFAGLYKLADDITAQKAAKAKADEAAKANKAALAKLAETQFSSKDYLSGTVADPNITSKLAQGLQQVYSFIEQNPGATASHIQLFASPIINQVAQYSEKSKELKRQLDAGMEQIKGVKGIDANKFRESFIKRAWGVQDGQVPENLNNTDITHNYADDVLNNDDIYNEESVRESIKNAKPIDYQYSQSTRNKAGVEKSTLYDVKSQPFYQPIVDASQKPTGEFEPKHELFTDGNQVVMHEWLGDKGEKTNAPIKLLDKQVFEQVFSPTNNPAAAAYLRNKVKQYTEGKTPLNSSQTEALSRAIAYDLVRDNMTEPASVKLKDEQKLPLPPRISIKVGGAGGAETRDIHTPALQIYNDLQSKKDTVLELIKQGKSDDEIASQVGLVPSAVAATRKGRYKARMPLNAQNLDAEFVNTVVEKANKGGGYDVKEMGETKKKEYDRSTLSVEVNNKGNWDVFSNLPGVEAKRIVTINPTTLNYKIQAKAADRETLSAQEKARTKKSSSYKIASSGKSYTHSQLLDMGYTEQQIKDAITNGNLQTQ